MLPGHICMVILAYGVIVKVERGKHPSCPSCLASPVILTTQSDMSVIVGLSLLCRHDSKNNRQLKEEYYEII